eukprot:UN2712
MPTPPSIDINITIIILIVMPIVVICIAIILIINIGIIRYLSEVKLRLLVPTRLAHAPARRERAEQHTGLNCAHLPGHYTLRHAALTRGKRAPGCKEPRDTRQRHRRNACGTAALESTGQLHAWHRALTAHWPRKPLKTLPCQTLQRTEPSNTGDPAPRAHWLAP